MIQYQNKHYEKIFLAVKIENFFFIFFIFLLKIKIVGTR